MPAPAADGALQTPQIVQNVENVLPIDQIFPAEALVLGGAMLVGVVLLHGFFMRSVQAHVSRNEPRLRGTPSAWRADLVMTTVVFVLLVAGLLEVVAWTAALKYAGLFRTWAGAAAYAATTYTTLGDVTVPPPQNWRMIGPIIAISGLFTFGWTGSVLVDVVGRVGRAWEAAQAAAPGPAGPAGAAG
jgi:hypothetical protein